MAELVDAYVSGAYARKGVGVRLPLPALEKRSKIRVAFFIPPDEIGRRFLRRSMYVGNQGLCWNTIFTPRNSFPLFRNKKVLCMQVYPSAIENQ